MMLQAHNLAGIAGIRHGFFTREGGISTGVYASLNGGIGSNDDQAHVSENRARMAAALGCPLERLLTAYQTHSPNVVIAETPWTQEQRPRADAIATRVRNLAIGVSTADCGPLLLADGRARVVAVVHAGWRGALTGVAEAAIAAMESLGARRADIAAALGPMIRQRNYEVGAELVERFIHDDRRNKSLFAAGARPGYAMFDLAGYIVARLQRAGVACEDLLECTYANPDRFYSYRRTTHRGEADYGRHISAIVLSD